MKNLFTAIAMAVGFTFASAQVAPTTSNQSAPKIQKMDKSKKAMPEKSQYTKKEKSVAPQSVNGVKMKKDGTPDRRYKEAKGLKKDGTPDKRFKENKSK